MAEPETVAGSRLNKWAALFSPGARRLILAIEAEARAAGAARYEAALREWIDASTPGIVHAKPFAEYGYDVAKAEITSILRELAAASLPVPEPPPQGDGLDVERLAVAIHLSHAASMFEVCGYPDRADAIATAAEYARLAPSRPAEERKP